MIWFGKPMWKDSIETIFDTLNAKAAIVAAREVLAEKGLDLPIMLSVTITDKSGRTLSGQTIEAFWNSVSHMPLFIVGINCALGPKQMRGYVEELSGIAPVFTSCYPNAGLPNAFGGFAETPESMAADLAEFARERRRPCTGRNRRTGRHRARRSDRWRGSTRSAAAPRAG